MVIFTPSNLLFINDLTYFYLHRSQDIRHTVSANSNYSKIRQNIQKSCRQTPKVPKMNLFIDGIGPLSVTNLTRIDLGNRHILYKLNIGLPVITTSDFNTLFNFLTKFSSGSCILKGSPDPSHFIFEINFGKRRIRHRTTLKSNDEFLVRLKLDLQIVKNKMAKM